MKDYTQTPTATHKPPSSNAGNRPDPCPFSVRICTCYKADKCVVKEGSGRWSVSITTGQTPCKSGEKVDCGMRYLHLHPCTACLLSSCEDGRNFQGQGCVR